MISDIRFFTDRHPKLSAALIALLMVVPPAIWVSVTYFALGRDFNSAAAVVVYAFIMQVLLCLAVERFVLVAMPFLMVIGGLAVCQIFYVISMATSGLVNALTYIISALGVSLLGSEFVGVFFGAAAYFLIVIVRAIVNKIRH